MLHGPALDLGKKEKSLLVVLTYCADHSAELMSWQPCATLFPVHISHALSYRSWFLFGPTYP